MDRSGTSASAPRGRKMRSKSAASGIFDRFDAACAGNLEIVCEAAPEANVRDDIFGPAVLVDHLGAAGSGQIAHLRGFVPVIDDAGGEFQVEFNRFALELKDSEFHAMRVKHNAGARKQRSGIGKLRSQQHSRYFKARTRIPVVRPFVDKGGCAGIESRPCVSIADPCSSCSWPRLLP